jgi:hypothetical protein
MERFMSDSRSFKPPGHHEKPTDIYVWKQFASLTLIPEQMNGYVLSGALWPNAVTVRPKFRYALVIITSCSNLLEITMSTVTP